MEATPYESIEYIEFYTESVSLSNQIHQTINHIERLKRSNYKLYGEANIFKALVSAISKAIKYLGGLFKTFISKITRGKIFGPSGSSPKNAFPTKSIEVMKGIYKTISNVTSSEIESSKKNISDEIIRALKSGADRKKVQNLSGGLSKISESDLEDVIVKITSKLVDSDTSEYIDNTSPKVNEVIDYIETENKKDTDGILKNEFKNFFPQNIKANLDDDIIDILNKVYKNNRARFLKNVDKAAELIFVNGNIPNDKFKEYYSSSNNLQFLYTDKFEMGSKNIKFGDHMKKTLYSIQSRIKEIEKVITNSDPSLAQKLNSESGKKNSYMNDISNMFPEYSGSKIERRKTIMKQGKNVEPLPLPKINDPVTYNGYIKNTRIENPQSILSIDDNFKTFVKFQNIFRTNADMYKLLQYVYSSFNNADPKAKELVGASEDVVAASDRLSDALSAVDQDKLSDNTLADIKDFVSSYRVFAEYIISVNMIATNQLLNAGTLKETYLIIRYQLIILMMIHAIRKYENK